MVAYKTKKNINLQASKLFDVHPSTTSTKVYAYVAQEKCTLMISLIFNLLHPHRGDAHKHWLLIH